MNNVRFTLTLYVLPGKPVLLKGTGSVAEVPNRRATVKAAVVTAPGATPIYADYPTPTPQPGEELIQVRASALSNLTRGRASGSHYSSANLYPAIAGTDGAGLTQDGRRVYFAMPEAPFGAMAELCPIQSRRTVPIPDSLDDITAAAIANPGMAAWAGLVERAHLVAGETVLINGATGTAGRIAVQLAKYLGAAKVIATARNAAELEALKQIGADITIPFQLDPANPAGAAEFEEALRQTFASGIQVVLDYLYGQSARTILLALAKTIDDAPVRFVHVGASSGEQSIDLPGAVLRSAAIELMGSGIGSVSRAALAQSIASVFASVQPAGLTVDTAVVPLTQVEETWRTSTGKPRIVFSIP
jgi:NADPH:quinone reductase-like Zn-dependent oxidoreductase